MLRGDVDAIEYELSDVLPQRRATGSPHGRVAVDQGGLGGCPFLLTAFRRDSGGQPLLRQASEKNSSEVKLRKVRM
jgi:hypothetical protein